MVTYKIKLKGSDGSDYSASMDWLKQQLGVCGLQDLTDDKVRVIWERIDDIERVLIEMQLPHAKQVILTTFKERKEINTRQLNVFIDGHSSTLERKALYEAFEHLVAEKTILFMSQGKGHPRLWFLRLEARE